MNCRALLTGLLTGAIIVAAGPATAAPDLPDPADVPPRTAIAVRSALPWMRWDTANDHEPHSALSMVKLYLVDYALRHGDGSPDDIRLGEQMIRKSDDAAASQLDAKYPTAIDAVAAEYHLTATRRNGSWESSLTSTADLADFLDAKLRTDPDSRLLTWMAEADPVAADGTVQDWGTAKLPGVLGTKWGWSDFGPPEVASASYGSGFTIAAHTYGTGEEQTADVLGVLRQVVLSALGAH
ncbi:hypothetical protein ACWDSJ_31195 [Nocardia sp. NPDC003482]